MPAPRTVQTTYPAGEHTPRFTMLQQALNALCALNGPDIAAGRSETAEYKERATLISFLSDLQGISYCGVCPEQWATVATKMVHMAGYEIHGRMDLVQREECRFRQWWERGQ